MKKIRIFQTALHTKDRLTEKKPVQFKTIVGLESELINLYPDVTYQTIVGFGGAFSEAAAVTLAKLPSRLRASVIAAYFDKHKGHGYSFCRTHINSCDFSLGNYSYDESAGDTKLKHFSLDHDRIVLIPLIKDAIKCAGGKIKIMASPWSPPAWMKENNEMNHGGRLAARYRQTWADYIVRYIQEMKKAGVPIWCITVQNEPKAAQTWDSCQYTGSEERDYVKKYLGPTLKRAGLGNTKILVWDHNRERLYERAATVFKDPAAARFVWGAGFHWYSGDHFEALDAVHKNFPEKHLIFTEGCIEKGPKPGSWETGERYGHHIIGDLAHGAEAWVDWNMVLDEKGGPNHVGNFCDAPVIADTKKGTIAYNSSYYYIGHFSRFIKPGAVRIGLSRFTEALEAVAFRNPDGTIAVIVLNKTEKPIPFNLRFPGDSVAKLQALSHSIQTIIQASAYDLGGRSVAAVS